MEFGCDPEGALSVVSGEVEEASFLAAAASPSDPDFNFLPDSKYFSKPFGGFLQNNSHCLSSNSNVGPGMPLLKIDTFRINWKY